MTRAEAVHGARQEFFASASLTLKEHSSVGWRHQLELREHRPERGAVPEDPVEAMLGVDDLAEYRSCPTLSVSSIAALVPVEFLHSRCHNVTPSELRRHACDDTSTKRTAMLSRVAFEYGQTTWALCTRALASRWDSPGSAIRSSTSMPNPCGIVPIPTVASTEITGGIARLSRAATYFMVLRKHAAYPAAKSCSGL